VTERRLPLSILAALALIAAAAVVFGACASSETDSPTTQAAMGTVEIRATDAPAEGVTSIMVTADNIQVHMADADEDSWITVVDEEKTFDLVEIEGAEVFLGEADVEVGQYTQIRLDVTEVIVTIDGVETTARLPSGKMKVVGNWDVREGETTVLTLDFEADKFVVVTGQGDAEVRQVIKLEVTHGDRPLKTKSDDDADDEPVAGIPQIPHTLEGRDDCLQCHAADAFKPFPTEHAGRTNDTCQGCH
jgi:hypothetical protein